MNLTENQVHRIFELKRQYTSLKIQTETLVSEINMLRNSKIFSLKIACTVCDIEKSNKEIIKQQEALTHYEHFEDYKPLNRLIVTEIVDSNTATIIHKPNRMTSFYILNALLADANEQIEDVLFKIEQITKSRESALTIVSIQ